MNYNQYIHTHILFGAGQLNNLHAQKSNFSKLGWKLKFLTE